MAIKNRPYLVQQLATQKYDLLVIGGGITGAGIALDAASRGLKTALVEKGDFAGGTSSRSTKLIHGGLRYLKQFEIALVREVGMERAVVHRLAPHLVTAEKMLLPITTNGTYGKYLTSVGLMVYDVLAGVEKPDQRVMLDKEQTLLHEPLLKDEPELEGSGFYAEYRTDDARLTMEVMKTAARYGAHSINYVEAQDFDYQHKKLKKVRCKDYLSGQEFTIEASFVVSAAGPWVDTLRKKDQSLSGKRLHLTKGVHLVVPHAKFPLKQAVYFDVPDGRMIFGIPRGKITYIGTTDTTYREDIDHVTTNEADASYLIDAVNHTFPSVALKVEDVVSSWAGLRPLIHEDGKSASELSRKDEIFESPSGLISIAGGKLTGYRKMGERIVDLVAGKLAEAEKRTFRACYTDSIVLMGGEFGSAQAVETYKQEIYTTLQQHGLDWHDADALVRNFGKQSSEIVALMPDYLPHHPPRVALGLAELQFTLRHEMVATATDFFNRRTGRLFFDIESVGELLEPVLAEMQRYLGWDEARTQTERQQVERAVFEAAQIFKV